MSIFDDIMRRQADELAAAKEKYLLDFFGSHEAAERWADDFVFEEWPIEVFGDSETVGAVRLTQKIRLRRKTDEDREREREGVPPVADPEMRELTTVEEIERMPLTAVIETPQQYVLERLAKGWYRPGALDPYTNPNPRWLPAKVLRERERPEEYDGLHDRQKSTTFGTDSTKHV